MKDSTVIGQVAMEYSENGQVINASFTPSIVVKADEFLLGQLKTIPQTDADVLKHNADLVLASWFNKTNEIELADREKWTIVSAVVDCDKYPSGAVKRCILEYTFKQIS